MNAPKRLKIRLPLETPDDFDIASIIPVFHRWIQERTLPGLLIDVADYKHVPNGPGILLIGDEGDYSLDQADGRLSLVYDRKRATGNDLSESIRILFESVQAARHALEAEAELGLRVPNQAAEIVILDRLQYPNNQGTFDAVKESMQAAIASVAEGATIELTYVASDHRRPLTLQLQPEQEMVLA
ncbi:MAG: hypothetical protein AAF702_27870 [Chloroflexota bacterium]